MWNPWLRFILLASLTAFGYSIKPVIIEEPVDVKVRQGDDVTLRCVVEHLPSDDLSPVQWTKGNFALGYDRNLSTWDRYTMVGDISIGEYNLHITNVDASEDENLYECQVTRYLLRTRKASLTVLVPPTGPVIDGQRDSGEVVQVNVVVGKPNEITCEAYNGKPAASLHWYRNGIEIFEGVSAIITEDGNAVKHYNTTATLRIIPTQDDADAMYACVMRSEALPSDQIGRKMMKLTMLKPPIVSVSLPTEIKEGTHVTAECNSAADPPVISYRWFVDGEAQIGETSSTFPLGVVDKSWNKKVIGCEARNDAGPSKRNNFELDVLYAPVFTNGSTKITAEIGVNVTMWCEWDSNPRASIYWIRDGDDEVIARSPKLELSSVTQDDASDYVCHANAGSMGNNRATTELSVRGPPMFSSMSSQGAVIGDDAILNCAIWSEPGIEDVTWTWVHMGTDFTIAGNRNMTSSGSYIDDDVTEVAKYRSYFVQGEQIARLVVAGADKDDLHSYSCSITNSYGTKSMQILMEEDTTGADDLIMLGMAVGGAVVGLLVVVAVLLLAIYCVRSRRQRKSTNFDKERMNTAAARGLVGNNGEKAYCEDETIPINHGMAGGEYRGSLSSHVGAPGSSVTGSDDTNPTPTSGQDDGYHTEEAHSWSRGDHAGKASIGSTSPAKNSALAGGYPGYVVNLPPPMETLEQPPYSAITDPLYQGDTYLDYPPRPMSANRYPYDRPPYDPTALAHPVSTIRSVSALGERLSPPQVRYVHRKYSEIAPASAGMYAPTSGDYYANTSRPLSPLHSAGEPMHGFGAQSYVGGNRSTPIPAAMPGSDRFYQVPGGSSQSSLDKFEKESALSASAVAARAIDPYENGTRMSNMSSRMSQSSRTSELRPFNARMATHV